MVVAQQDFSSLRFGRVAVSPQRVLWRWWRRLSPAGQDKLATLGPLASVLVFLVVMVAAFWYLRNEDEQLQRQAVVRDADLLQQQVRLRLIDHQEQLARLARDLAARDIDPAELARAAAAFGTSRQEVVTLRWVASAHESRTMFDAFGNLQASDGPLEAMVWGLQPPVAASAPGPAASARGPERDSWAYLAARDLRMPMYSRAYRNAQGMAAFEVHVPMLERGRFLGTLAAEIAIEPLMRQVLPTEVTQRHSVAVIDDERRVLANTRLRRDDDALLQPRSFRHQLPLAPAMNGLSIRVTGHPQASGLLNNAMFWMVVGLSGLTVWMLLGTWRHVRHRSRMQFTLMQETQFRRAMENSMLTGLRAVDQEGRITYVNPAFCAMTGFTEEELIGALPPFPYWPPDKVEENHQLLRQQLQGLSPASGVELKVQGKDGAVFDARMYVAPLVDAKGVQTGWVTSMTNITEAKRVRDQLSASHERFTTVLEGLEAAVSVLSVQQGELLFANRSYRLWFGADARGHALLAEGSEGTVPYAVEDDAIDHFSGLPAHSLEGHGAAPREVYAAGLDKWFDVRARYLQWTDGSLAQMLIATDISARRQAEELAAQQAEKAQVSSRLITMGEMASSVAHELNQPLTAITNYCNGMLSRLKADNIDRGALGQALEKTARQAERAGQIIHRIRAFVKKSEPQRVPARAEAIVEDAVELASIELRRRDVKAQVYVAHHLPMLRCDPILIEQVLMNLLKNAAEAIDQAKMPPGRRHIELRVLPRHTPELGGVVEFSVTDAGPGLSPEVLSRLYEAFFSTKREGLGIGLSLCRSIVESHRGRIKGENLYTQGHIVGCRFAFTLPVEPQAPPGSGRGAAFTADASGLGASPASPLAS